MNEINFHFYQELLSKQAAADRISFKIELKASFFWSWKQEKQ